jgi:hypothetical protein
MRRDPPSWMLTALLDWLRIDSQQGSLAIISAATRSEYGLVAEAADGFRGGAKYFNRIWEAEASPYTRDAVSRV